MKNPRRSPDRFRKNGRSRSQQFYPSQANRQQSFEALVPPSSSRCGEGASADKSSECDRGIAILLLDAENLKLDVNAEQFLASLYGYTLEVKIAFANWKNPSTGKLDAELYDRGYELIHVPGGANSADGKMIAFGAAILYRYPAVKQVFVCSSDGLLNHLCNQLQNQGLTVFRVRRQNALLSVENIQTGESNHYSCEREEEVPSFEELANQIAELLQAEHKSIDERIARFSRVAELFQERRTVALNSTTSQAAALSESAENKICSGTKECVTPLVVDLDIARQKVPETKSVNSIGINSLDALEKILVAMIAKAIVELKQNAIPVTKIKKQFYTKYQCHADLLVKNFLADSSLINFFQSRPSVFKIELIGNEHQVAIARKAAASKTESSATLEASIVNIVQALTAKSSGSYIPINQVASEFNKQYGQPITKKMQSLKLGKNFIDFLQSCPRLKVQKKGKDYQMAIAQSDP